MKKGLRILRKVVLWLLLIVLICIVSAAIFRNAILASFIPSIVSSQTDNRVNIEFDKIYMGWDGELYITHPSLTFDSTFLYDSGTVEVEELAFDTIHLYGFSYRQAIFDNIFLADSLRVSGPTVKVKERQANNTESKESDFDPQRVLEMITGNTGRDPGIMIRIGRILIDYGKLDLRELGMESTGFFSRRFLGDNSGINGSGLPFFPDIRAAILEFTSSHRSWR